MVDFTKQIIGFLRLGNLVMIALYFYVFETFLLTPVRIRLEANPALTRFEFALLVIDVVLVALIGYWMNDWRDRSADRLNRPNRFLVNRDLSPGGFMFLLSIPIVVGMIITVYLGLKTGNEKWMILYPLVLIALTYYALRSKRIGFAGNLLVSALIAFLPVLLIIAEWSLFVELFEKRTESFLAISSLLMVYAGLMFFSNLARELIKDCQDIKGDKAVYANTLPIRKGLNYTRWVIATLLGIAVACELYFLIFLSSSLWTLIAALGLIALIIATGIVIYVFDTDRRYQVSSFGVKVIMLLGIAQFAIYMLLDYSLIN